MKDGHELLCSVCHLLTLGSTFEFEEPMQGNDCNFYGHPNFDLETTMMVSLENSMSRIILQIIRMTSLKPPTWEKNIGQYPS